MHKSRRRGFSLVELLVVIAVIGVLIALIVPATMALIRNAKVAATQATIQQVSGLVRQRIEAVYRLRVQPVATNTCNSSELAKIYNRKALYKLWLPQTWAEVQVLATDQGVTITPAPPSPNPATESAEVLYWLLTEGPTPPDSTPVGDMFTSQNSADTDANGRKEVVDGWGNPIFFWRWPTKFLRATSPSAVPIPPIAVDSTNFNEVQQWNSRRAMMPSLPRAERLPTSGSMTAEQIALGTDPDDPSQLAANCSMAYCNSTFHDVGTVTMPLLCSGGEDGRIGLEGYWALPSADITPDPPHYIALRDNITNLNVKSGGK